MFCIIIYTILFHWLLRYILIPILFILFNFYYKIPNERVYINKIKCSGTWAVVTGATDGIGKEYCRNLAKLGRKIFLLSRNEEKLKNVQKELTEEFGVEVQYLSVDFTKNDIYDKIRDQLHNLDIGILVNNVGMTQSSPIAFHSLTEYPDFLSNMVNCNILSYISVTQIVLPQMVARGRGIIVNISSASSLQLSPLSSLYSSSKCYLSQFSRNLYQEVKEYKDIHIQTVLPFFVKTKFIGKFSPSKILAPSAREYVESAIKTIGVMSETYGCVSHSIQGIITTSMPDCFKTICSKQLSKMRARALAS